MPMMLFVFWRKNPVLCTRASTASGSACARSAGVGYRAKSAGVTWLTISSVVCAERIVATSSWNGESCSSAQSDLASPGYSPANRSRTISARCFEPLGLATP